MRRTRLQARAVGKGSTSSMCRAPAANAERHSGAIGQSRRERRQQPLVGRRDRQAPPPALLVVADKARALLAAARQLVKAVGELQSRAVQLEAPRATRIGGVEARERRLGRGVAVHEGEGAVSEPRSDARAHEKLEQLVAVITAATVRAVTVGGGRRHVISGLLGRRDQLRAAGAERIETELALKRSAVAGPRAPPLRGALAQERAQQLFNFAHELLEREADPVPLDQRELRIVQPPLL